MYKRLQNHPIFFFHFLIFPLEILNAARCANGCYQRYALYKSTEGQCTILLLPIQHLCALACYLLDICSLSASLQTSNRASSFICHFHKFITIIVLKAVFFSMLSHLVKISGYCLENFYQNLESTWHFFNGIYTQICLTSSGLNCWGPFLIILIKICLWNLYFAILMLSSQLLFNKSSRRARRINQN